MRRVVEDRERYVQLLYDLLRSAQVVNADRQDLRIQALYLLVHSCQLAELPTADRSPEGPIEDHDQVLVAAVGRDGHVRPGC